MKANHFMVRSRRNLGRETYLMPKPDTRTRRTTERTQSTTIRVPLTVRDRLIEAAQREHRSLSNFIMAAAIERADAVLGSALPLPVKQG